jgi:hypothetical protein
LIHKCTGCGGRGQHPTSKADCLRCLGTGKVRFCLACGTLRAIVGFVRDVCGACISALRGPEDKRDALADGAWL